MQLPSDSSLVGVDGCRGGWLAAIESVRGLGASVYSDWRSLMRDVPRNAIVAVDIPIGLPSRGSRACDLEARRYLGAPRCSSVFPAPVRACLADGDYEEICRRHREVDERGISRQTYSILRKIREVDVYLAANPLDGARIREVHPELSFAAWNAGVAMQHRKSKAVGRRERERLIDREWPRERERLWGRLRGCACKRDDLNDALAALWTARRIGIGTALRMPQNIEKDERELRMEIVA